MITIKNGGPAFPHDKYIKREDGVWGVFASGGMSLRDWFAGQALPQAIEDYDRKTRTGTGRDEYVMPWATSAIGTREELIARQAYCYSDAMLKAREGGAS